MRIRVSGTQLSEPEAEVQLHSAGTMESTGHVAPDGNWSTYFDTRLSQYAGYCLSLEDVEDVIREFSYSSHAHYILQKTEGQLRTTSKSDLNFRTVAELT